MFNLDPTKFLIVVAVALVVLGPDKLPAAVRQMGKYWNEFQRIRTRLQAEMDGALSTINETVGPIGDVINMGVAQVKGPIGMVGSLLSSPVQTGVAPSAGGAADGPAAPEQPESHPVYVDSGVPEGFGAWSTVDGVAHPPIDSDPYLN